MQESSPTLMMINLSKAWGGGEKWFLTVGEALQARGFQLIMICYPGSALAARLAKSPLPYETAAIRFSSFLNPFKVLRMRQLMKFYKPDMIMMNASHELKTFGLMGHLMGVPHIIFRRGVSYALKRNSLNRWYMKRVVTAFLANSHATFNAVTNSFPGLLSKHHLRLNNGILVKSWNPQADKKQALQIGMSARLAEEKGIDRALLAMKKVVEHVPQASLHILGQGPDEENLKALHKELGLGQAVVFHGFVHDVQALLATCNIFLFTPKMGEGTSIALIEAMAMEMPCVVFDTPAMSEVVLDGKTGYVVKDGDIEGLAARLVHLLKKPNVAREMGIQGRERAEKLFNLPTSVIDPLEKWLRSMTNIVHD